MISMYRQTQKNTIAPKHIHNRKPLLLQLHVPHRLYKIHPCTSINSPLQCIWMSPSMSSSPSVLFPSHTNLSPLIPIPDIIISGIFMSACIVIIIAAFIQDDDDHDDDDGDGLYAPICIDSSF